ncbi:RNA-binding S4 domain-containing protein [Eubacteriales bacterium OttesenSCG-928-M02]|nr:RNA-binding S4 domain-containing protein [Eubacteriales bacterium OttesenSCG-928-M02]
MRIDKYLKVSRLIKRRTVANAACDAGKIWINDRVAKPGDQVKIGDRIAMEFKGEVQKYEVLSVSEHALKEQAGEMYRKVE